MVAECDCNMDGNGNGDIEGERASVRQLLLPLPWIRAVVLATATAVMLVGTVMIGYS